LAFRRVPTFVDPHPTVSTFSTASSTTSASGCAAAEFEYADVEPNCRKTPPRGEKA